MERIKRVVITWEDENWEYELELTGAEAEHFTESEALAGKCLQQILLGTCTFDALFHNVVLFNVCAFLLLQR